MPDCSQPVFVGFCLFSVELLAVFGLLRQGLMELRLTLNMKAKGDLEILVLLYLLPKCWDCMVMPLCPASNLSQVRDAHVIISVRY